MHLPAQAYSPAGQLVTQLPFEHAVPEAQLVPHDPQFCGSRLRFVQNAAPPPVVQASRVVAGHAHDPPEHCCPARQAFPHEPQLFESTWVFAQ